MGTPIGFTGTDIPGASLGGAPEPILCRACLAVLRSGGPATFASFGGGGGLIPDEAFAAFDGGAGSGVADLPRRRVLGLAVSPAANRFPMASAIFPTLSISRAAVDLPLSGSAFAFPAARSACTAGAPWPTNAYSCVSEPRHISGSLVLLGPPRGGAFYDLGFCGQAAGPLFFEVLWFEWPTSSSRISSTRTCRF